MDVDDVRDVRGLTKVLCVEMVTFYKTPKVQYTCDISLNSLFLVLQGQDILSLCIKNGQGVKH